MKLRSVTLSLCLAMTLGGLSATPSAYADRTVRFERQNPAGGTTAGSMRNHSGTNGGHYLQRRVVRTDGQDNGRVSGGSAFQTPGGASGLRGGSTYYHADGSVQHASGLAASGTRGSITSRGGYTRNPDGTITQQRSTHLSNAATGNSYQGSTSYDATNGLSHSATCFNAAGDEIACPSR